MKRNQVPILIGFTTALLVAGGMFVYDQYRYYPVATGEQVMRTPDAPAILAIPTLDVEALVEFVGRTPEGNMGSPTSFTGIAWFKEGAVPGARGSAVVAGHLDNALGRSGVFKNLDKLRVGDEVLVQTVSGEVLRFRVTSTVIYAHDAPTEEVFTRDDGTYLNLITCAGNWLSEAKTYSERLVVFTELVSSEKH